MDGPHSEHSDSDSGESWTLLDHSPTYAAEAPLFPENAPKNDTDATEHTEKDEDTDGISIISDSDVESPMTAETLLDTTFHVQEKYPREEHISQHVLEQPHPCHEHDKIDESIRNDDILGDSTGKLRTYVHRRNKRLSTVLNIIVLGSIITAAGVAIGHMWGVRDECIVQSTPSVNKILSNLYKLQEENAYLRSKLKELTLATQKNELGKYPKNTKCRKVFEESLSKKNIDTITKCVDYDNSNTDKILESHMLEPEFEKEFIHDINKLKSLYKQNKTWLDKEIAKRQKIQNQNLKSKNVGSINIEKTNINIPSPVMPQWDSPEIKDNKININIMETIAEKLENEGKASYAESLKSNEVGKREKRETNDYKRKEFSKKKKDKESDKISVRSVSEEDIVKDKRYMEIKPNQENKKHDRRKVNKKQKRRNKFEQWEMKSGYKNDYDDISLLSAYENDFVSKNNDRGKNINLQDYISRPLENESKPKVETKKGENELKDKQQDWYEKRMTQRSDARRKLEKELFGDNPSSAGWYFRRMKKREQCRVKGDNTTYRKLSKRNMNFKTKH